ncbi:hypothetical protein, partial [Variovorax sp. MHTC-1]|uniref:hypothetical protein n=1 Tax=Variovorax sp. MHTC-1 TaxID=2495593 RepID=UPI0021AF3613
LALQTLVATGSRVVALRFFAGSRGSCISAPSLRSLFDVTGTTLRRALPDLDARIAARDLAPVFDWLCTNVWSQLRPRGGTPTN